MSTETIVVPSRQEMFNRAWNGLKNQGWAPSRRDGMCLYDDGPRRCAWGHVDPEGTAYADGLGTVKDLARTGTGLAARLSPVDLAWACDLQQCHDGAIVENIQARMEGFARKYGLSIPAEETPSGAA